jgi:hypothetical protein
VSVRNEGDGAILIEQYGRLAEIIVAEIARSITRPKVKSSWRLVGEGIRDALNRRISTNDWVVWKEEVVWISTYFTFGVWLSIGMMFVRF